MRMESTLHIQSLLLDLLIISNNYGDSYDDILYSLLLFHFLSPKYFPLLFLHLSSFLKVRYQDLPNCKSQFTSVTPLLPFNICGIRLQILITGKDRYATNTETFDPNI
jgi:hypothetical protein